MNRQLVHIVLFFLLLNVFLVANKTFAQVPPDSAAVVPPDTLAPVIPSPVPPILPEKKDEKHSVIVMEFIKQKVEHSPDSTFFNILKITNNNAKTVDGIVTFTIPRGWKLLSKDSMPVTIQPDGNPIYIPVRVSLARTAPGGVSYLINATLVSNRPLFPDKNQNSVSKACYITIPKKTKWEIQPENRTVYFDRYREATDLKLKLTNRGNGSEVVKLEFEIGSWLQMFGSLGNRMFTTFELKPHSDTVLSFPVKYRPDEESALVDRDSKKLTIRVTAISDTIVKKTSVNFKFLESSFNNILFERATPLTIDFQVQNLLSEVNPRIFFAASGFVWFKNDHTLDYYLRLPSVSFTEKGDIGTFLWQRTRMHAFYKADRWEVRGGDISSSGGSGLIQAFGRGVGGSYEINDKHKVGATFAATPVNPIYSGNVSYLTSALPRNIILGSSITYLTDNYNKLNIFGGDISVSYPFLRGHNIRASLAVSQTQHKYDNQTFTDAFGNFITTSDPKAAFLGFGAQLNYSVNLKKLRSSITGTYSTPHFSQYYGSRMMMVSTANYQINKKFYLLAHSNVNLQDPQIYNRGILIPENNYLSGRHKLELANRVNSKLTLFAGPFIEHISHKRLKLMSNGDSVNTRFKSMSPKVSLRLNYKNNLSGFVSPYILMGYTFITSAEDTTLGTPSPLAKTVFYNAKVGVNVIQNNFGLNIFYYYGPHDLVTQNDYYYFGYYSKSIRIMPYFQKYYFDKLLFLSSYNSYYYEALSSMERVTLNARLNFCFDKGWNLFVDNNLYMFSRVSSEGTKIYSRSYYLNVGFRKSFDIPQPRVKYYDLKVVCFKDMNGNKIMDDDEQGMSDIVISIDRLVKFDSITKRSVKFPGQFVPAEMVTDNYGQVDYYKIPEGEFNVRIIPLLNLIDLYNINGQVQKINVSKDTTYYIPFVQSYRVVGRVVLNRDAFSSLGFVSPANIRITATDSAGNSFNALTTSDGSYTLYAPFAGEYKVNINNVFGDYFVLQEAEYVVSFDGAKEYNIDFIFSEKKRKLNINGKGTDSTSTGSIAPVSPSGNGAVKDSVSAQVPALTGSGISYRIQLGSSSTQIPPSQYAQKFKNADKIQEYVQNGMFKYTSGDFNTWEFDKATEYKDKLIAAGYKDAFIAFFKDGKRIK